MLKKIVKKIRQLPSKYPVSQKKPLKAYYNWLLANYEMTVHAETVNAKPLKLTIDPTNICQLQCPFCPTGAKQHTRKPGKAEMEMVPNLLSEVGDCLFSIDFYNWGEPLLNLDVLLHWIEAAKSKNIITAISSNMSVPLTKDQAEKIVASGLDRIIISIDGASEETYSRYRVNGKFNLVIENAKKIIEAKKCTSKKGPWIVWRFLVFGHNEHEIEQASSMAHELGFDEIIFSVPSVNQCEERDTWVAKDPRYCPQNQIQHKIPSRCDWHYVSAAINYDGTINPCCALHKMEDDFGSIGRTGEYSYMKAFNSSHYKNIRKSLSSKVVLEPSMSCNRCPIPGIKDYAKELNRQILILLLLRIFRATPVLKLLV
ncbi:MAG: radical SAM protein [Anaerolineales bacterium]